MRCGTSIVFNYLVELITHLLQWDGVRNYWSRMAKPERLIMPERLIRHTIHEHGNILINLL
jgi:hypothetical protein